MHLNESVNEIAQKGGEWKISSKHGGTYTADALCLTLPSHESARLLAKISRPLAGELSQIPYSSVATLNLAYRRDDVRHPLNGSGFVIPAIEKRAILACTFCSSKYAGRAPEGKVLLRAFIGGALFPEELERDDDSVVARVCADLKELLGITATPLFTELNRYPRSMPQYHLGHTARIDRIEKFAQDLRGLHITASSVEGVGIPGCIHRGEQAAEKIVTAIS